MPPSTNHYGPHQLAAELGTSPTVVDRALDMGLISPPDQAGRYWSAADVEEIRGRWPQVMATIEAERELGAVRCAELLARRTGLRVSAADVAELAARGMLHVTRLYKRRPLYRVAEVEALAADPVARALLPDIVARPGAPAEGMGAAG
ncbi:MAG: hypothetical protein ACRDNF_01630 [Streptosporangiaceae bacterium]